MPGSVVERESAQLSPTSQAAGQKLKTASKTAASRSQTRVHTHDSVTKLLRQRMDEAQLIFNNYVRLGAVWELNIDFETRNQVADALKRLELRLEEFASNPFAFVSLMKSPRDVAKPQQQPQQSATLHSAASVTADAHTRSPGKQQPRLNINVQLAESQSGHDLAALTTPTVAATAAPGHSASGPSTAQPTGTATTTMSAAENKRAAPWKLSVPEQLDRDIRHVFDETQSSVVDLMQVNSFHRFRASDVFQRLLATHAQLAAGANVDVADRPLQGSQFGSRGGHDRSEAEHSSGAVGSKQIPSPGGKGSRLNSNASWFAGGRINSLHIGGSLLMRQAQTPSVAQGMHVSVADSRPHYVRSTESRTGAQLAAVKLADDACVSLGIYLSFEFVVSRLPVLITEASSDDMRANSNRT